MCGIFGLVDRAQPVDLRLARKAGRMLRHRGPDDEGYLVATWSPSRAEHYGGDDTVASLNLPDLDSCDWAGPGVVLAHRRLSILDVSPAGHQPMSTRDGRYWLAYNGEIYNYLEIRDELTALGRQFHTRCDTEVLLEAYAQWGVDALARFVGMFSFAIVDLQMKTLVLARDFFGIKPLYYTRTASGLAFASEIPPLLEVPGVKRTANPRRIYDYLRFGLTDHGDQTMFAQIEQVPPAHYVRIQLDRDAPSAAPVKYWSLQSGSLASQLSFNEAADRLRNLFLESVGLHLRSDVPVGACLSGGIDSSAIVCGMRAVGGPGLTLNTFTYVATDPRLSEERWATIASQSASALMHTVGADPSELVNDLEGLIAVQGEPFGSTSIFAQNRVFRRAHENGIKVMLDGQGADEMFLGYPIFHSLRVARLLSRGRLYEGLRFAARATANGPSFASILLYAGGRLAPAQVQPMLMRLVGKPAEPPWLNAAWFRRHGVPLLLRDQSVDESLLRCESLRAVTETSLPSLLRYEDRNSMAYSVESRVPILSPRIAEFAFGLPDEYLLSDRALTKSVLRSALRGLVPDIILDRRDKVGFETPQGAWLARLRPHLRSVLGTYLAQRWGPLNGAQVCAALDAESDLRNLSRPVWAWYNLVRWADHFDVIFD
ncbi:MAG: asparagine synthase (glutamine-hydrolyzing), partial [Chloroflexi bacterium]|nr:asparagine synthase (glutamine-hydrolyzing) [Chloroflexota bacterium]